MTSLWRIFITYIKIGMMAFGGGAVMLPLIEQEFSHRLHLVEEDKVCELFALAQSIPGIIAINMAIILGHRLRGWKGALAAAIGVMLPSIVIITVIAAFFDQFADIPWVQRIFRGLNVAVLVIIAQAVLKLAKNGIKDKVTFALFAIVLIVYLITGANPAIFTVAGAFAGLLLSGRRERHE